MLKIYFSKVIKTGRSPTMAFWSTKTSVSPSWASRKVHSPSCTYVTVPKRRVGRWSIQVVWSDTPSILCVWTRGIMIFGVWLWKGAIAVLIRKNGGWVPFRKSCTALFAETDIILYTDKLKQVEKNKLFEWLKPSWLRGDI